MKPSRSRYFLQGPMFRRHRPMQRLFVWFALVAMGLATFAPVVSQVLRPPAEMPIDCIGHGSSASMPATPDRDTGHGGMSMAACGYCNVLAHHPGLPSVPVVLMRPPASIAEAAPPALPARPSLVPWLFDTAPRGPPALT